MIGFIRSLAPKASYGKDFWKIVGEFQSRQIFADQTSKVADTAFGAVQCSSSSPANRGLWTGLNFALSRKNEPCRFIYDKHSFCRGYATHAAALDPSSGSSRMARSLAFTGLVLGSGLATYFFYPRSPPPATQSVYDTKEKEEVEDDDEELHTISNWSNTHEVKTRLYFQPESLEELEKLVQNAHQQKQKIRAVGSALSPNGIGLCSEGMVGLALMDKILNVDQKTGRVTVQAGARVEQVVEALRPYGLTLQNFASIKQQQIGGFIQVGAHGTGGKLPPVDEQVVGLKLVTAARGTLDLTPESDPELFYFARCGLGALGVVAEVTLQCVPRHRLLEHTLVTDVKGVQQNHKKWLNENKHLRYMWIPDTDTVVVVQCNPLPDGKDQEGPKIEEIGAHEKLKEVRALYKDVAAKYGLHNKTEVASAHSERPSPTGKEGLWSGTGAAGDQGGYESRLLSDEQLSELSFTELRDILIAVDPGNREHIMRINRAEAEFWKLSEGYRTGWSDEILGFDCGGQQWVSEVSFPAGSLEEPSMADVQFLESLLDIIKKEGIPAPAPIEQRWTARSRSPMSLASSSSPDALFSWVGIIMYLPTDREGERAAITTNFFAYRKAAQRQLWDRFNAHEHWAKIEVPTDDESSQWLRERLQKRFPLETFNRFRSELDPHLIFTNDHLDQLVPGRNV